MADYSWFEKRFRRSIDQLRPWSRLILYQFV